MTRDQSFFLVQCDMAKINLHSYVFCFAFTSSWSKHFQHETARNCSAKVLGYLVIYKGVFTGVPGRTETEMNLNFFQLFPVRLGQNDLSITRDPGTNSKFNRRFLELYITFTSRPSNNKNT